MAVSGARILLGTASWTDRPLIESGKFHPPSATSAETRLRHYASQFPLVEADTTYYGLPTERTARAWVERTPDGFTFDVKAYSLFTDHPIPIARLPKAIKEALPPALANKRQFYRKDAPPEIVDLCWSTFVDALSPLHDGRRLGVILFQFPKWVLPARETHRYFEEIRDRLGPYRAAVEFRNELWMDPAHREATLALLGDLDISYVCVDEPQGFASSVPPVAAATNDLAVVRFHGRNAKTWEARTASSAERFDHYYTPRELDEWAPKIAGLAQEAEELHLVLNTNNFDQGPANARLLGERLHAAGIPVAGWRPSPPATDRHPSDSRQRRLL